MVRLSAGVIRVSCAHRNQVLVQSDRLVQPLPGLVQRVDAVSNTYTIATAVKGHSFQLARREDEMGLLLRTAVCCRSISPLVSHFHSALAFRLFLFCFCSVRLPNNPTVKRWQAFVTTRMVRNTQM